MRQFISFQKCAPVCVCIDIIALLGHKQVIWEALFYFQTNMNVQEGEVTSMCPVQHTPT